MDKTMNFLGLCKRAGALVTGEDSVGAAARSGSARLVMTASDAAENTRGKAEHIAAVCGVTALRLPYDKDSLGELLGRRVCAVLAITDKELAKAFAQKLAADNGDYAPAAKALEERLKSRRERRKSLAKPGGSMNE